MDIDIEDIIKLIEHRRLSTVMLTAILLDYCSTDRSELSRVMRAVDADELQAVYEILAMYPRTELGWSTLPANRSTYLNPDLSRDEEADLESRQFREDREHVEYLRQLIRPTSR